MSKINPLADWLVCTEEKVESKSSLILTQDQPTRIVIQSIGPDVAGVKVGEHIVHRNNPLRVNRENKEYLLIQESDVIGVIVDD